MFKPLTIPKKLQKDLPFANKPKVIRKEKDQVQHGRIAVVRESREKKVSAIHLGKLLMLVNLSR